MATKKYYKLYFLGLFNSIKKAIGWRQLLYLLVSLLVGASIFYLCYGVNAMSKEVLNFIAFSLAPAGFLAIIFVGYYLVQTHVQLYSKIEAEANLLTWKDVEIKPFDFPKTSGFGVGLEMISHKSKYEFDGRIIEHLINEVVPKVTIISKIGETEHVQYSLPLLVGSTTFVRQEIVRTQEQLKNDGHLSTAISIANWDENRAWITIWKKDENRYGEIDFKEDATCSIQIEIRNAKVEIADPMASCAITCDLLFHKDEIGKKKVSIAIKKRYPNYED